MKKVISLVLTLAMVVAFIPSGLFTIKANAATSGTTGDCTWTLDGTTLTISGNGNMDNYSGYATPWGESITSVIIKDGVTSIGDCAFYSCNELTSINIPDSVTSIGDCAFRYCESLTNINLPDSVTSIGDYAFDYCISLTSINIPDSVTSIGKSVFYECRSLTSITIPDSVTSIGDYAFYKCTSLTNVVIPNSVISVGKDVFYDTAWYYSLPWGCVYIGSVLYTCRGTHPSTINIKEGTRIIADGAFENCSSITSVTIPNSVTSIGHRAFFNCSSLTSITIPDSVTSIGHRAFFNCSSLTSITIPDSVTSIGDLAFYKCTGLTNITVPNSVTSIGEGAFENCTNLKSVYITDMAAWCSIDYADEHSSPLYLGAKLYLNNSLVVNIKIPNKTTKISEYAFYKQSNITSVVIPNSVTSIGNDAFYGCTGLTNITIPNSVTTIGGSAFYGCTGLTNITIPNSVTTIGYYTFENCSGLTSITIPDSVTNIGCGAFKNCTNLESITLPFIGSSRNTGGFSQDSVFGYIFGYTSSYTSGTTLQYYTTAYVINGVPYAYYYIPSSLTSVTITDVTHIPNFAFYNCENLTSITIPDSVTSIGKDAFYNTAYYNDAKNWENDVLYIGKSLISAGTGVTGSYIIRDGTKLIMQNAFGNSSNLTSIIIPNSVTTIGSSAFYGCTGLTNITIPNSITTIGNYTFENCSGLTSITIPDSVTNIGGGAFKNCTNLESITLPFIGSSRDANETSDAVFGHIFGYSSSSESGTTWQYYSSGYGNYYYIPSSLKSVTITDATQIPYGAFYNCAKLTSITIPDSVNSIGSSAFSYCSSLTSITIPGGVNSIDSSVFKKCTAIETVYYGGTPAMWSALSNKPSCSNVVYYNRTGIEVTTLPTKTQYIEATEALRLYGGKLTVHYMDNETEIIDLSKATVTGFDNTKIGKQTLTVSYSGFSTTFEVEILELPNNTTEFAGGKGVSYSPFLVSTKEHLNNVSKYPNAHFKQVKDIVFSSADFAQGGAYYNNGYGWTPIGKNSASEFTGSYDGGGYAIKNIKININTANAAYGGLFGYSSGTLKNITIENSSISISAEGSSYAGGIVGYQCGGTIENCHNKNTSAKAQYAGGIVGYAYYIDEIKDCTNSGNVLGTNMGGIVGRAYYVDKVTNCKNTANFIRNDRSGAYIGGIVGAKTSGNILIDNCINTGRIYAEGTDTAGSIVGGDTRVGGILGYSSSGTTITNCINTNDLYGDCSGGIGGSGYFKIENCKNQGNISGSIDVGGIVGYLYSGSVTASSNTGKITGCCYKNNKLYSSYASYVGGIMGVTPNGASVSDCYNTGAVSGGNYSGGIAGKVQYVYRSYNIASVTSSNYAGGITASLYSSYGYIYDSFNTGKISGKYAAGILAELLSGGVKTSYNIGEIKTTGTSGYMGAIVAYQTGGSITDCYYLDNNANGVGFKDYSVSSTPDTVKLTEANMKKAESFEGFNFTEIWTTEGNADYLYPELHAVEMVEKSVTHIEITHKPNKLTYLEGDPFDATGLVVTAHHNINTSSVITDYTISGYSSTVGTKTITVSYGGKTATFTVTVKSRVPSTVTSSKHTISGNVISKIGPAFSISNLLSALNGGVYCKVYKGNTEVSGNTAVGTGMVVKIMDGNTVKASYTAIVTADTNGDGNITVTDMIAIKAHVLKKSTLSGVYATAADTNGDKGISITDFIQVKAKILGKGAITAR